MASQESSTITGSTDILIVGAGAIGLTTAWNLAQHGASVTIVERQRFGREASWAGAGMLPPGNPDGAFDPESRLRAYSHELWDELAHDLKTRTGIHTGYRRCGSVELAPTDSQITAWETEGIRAEQLTGIDVEKHVPGLRGDFGICSFLPDFGQTRNPRHLQALAAACRQAGVELVENVQHLSLTSIDDQTVTAASPDRTFHADRICICAGSWTNQCLESVGAALPVAPVRGQIAQVRVPQLPFSCVIEQQRRYLVPRADGLILIGSTEEHVGFEKRNTTEGIAGLLQFAESVVPELGSAELVRCWAGLRPGSPDELPFLGRVPPFDNLFVGAGHFRSGLQMSPGTGRVLADLLLDRPPEIDLTGLTMDRIRNFGCEPKSNEK